MIELGSAAASGAIGVVAVLVVGWGAWLSIGSSRHGPGWALQSLTRWRRLPAVVTVIGLGLVFSVSPVWVGLGAIYIGLVTWWLTAMLRRNLSRVLDAYGEFDGAGQAAADIARRSGRWLIGGATLLALIAVWDMTMRGWPGVFGLILALGLATVGLMMDRSSARP